MKIRTAISALGLAAFCALPLARADSQTHIEGVPVSICDSVDEARAALHTDVEPEVMAPLPGETAGKTFIHLKTKGLWAFFNSAGKVETIRLEAPFAGVVGGVRIGDKLEHVKTTLGEPLKPPFEFGRSMAHIYALTDVVSLRVDINKSGTVETLFLIK